MVRVNNNNTDFLFTSYVLDYGDNYHRQIGEPSSELEREARKIRRRYREQHEYLKALATYNEYMELIIEKNGGKQLFKFRFKEGLITDYIPHKPRMKNTKINRTLEKYEIIISESKNTTLDINGAVEVSKLQSNTFIEFTDNEDKKAEKIIDSGLSIVDKVITKNDPIDYLEAYFANKRTNTKKTKNYAVKNVTLTELMSGDYNEDEEETDDIIYYKGNMMNRDAVQQLARMEELNSLGWNSLKIMKSKNGTERITKILKNRKKKSKKEKKKQKEYNSFMVNVMGDNDYDDYSDFEDDMLNFSAKNIFK